MPSSKSATHRHLNLALLARAPVTVRRPLLADDTRLFLNALGVLGFTVTLEGDSARLQPEEPPASGTIPCGNAGTMIRLLTASLTAVTGRWRLDGTPRLRDRPLGPLVEALRKLGAEISWSGRPGYPPIEVVGGTLRGGATEVDAGESSQYLSALLMAGLAAREPSRIRVRALTSSPYVQLTLGVIAEWGGRVHREGDLFMVDPPAPRRSEVEVEGDFSAAAYPAAAAALVGGPVQISGLRPDSAQGDRQFLDLLASMGAEISWQQGALEVRRDRPLEAVEVDLSGMPDQVPTLAALAPFARGMTRIGNVPHLRIKESDRLAAMAEGLARLGVPVVERSDGLEVEGAWASGDPPSDPVLIDTRGDHRIAMSFALLGLRRPGVRIAEPGVVAKSYPAFWRDLEGLLVG